ncbi:MAG: DUF1491 domain-containing protein [Mesorhizobium amorphae]|nr:MAG: DUF1491 domain-containing protein [Mesorhizobium amorphae]
MRLTSDFWVSALVRRVSAEGGFGAVVRRGAAEAGAVFIVVRDRMGNVRLYAPAPQTSYGEDRPSERVFVENAVPDEAALDARLEREKRFDPDFWVVEIEPGASPLEALVTLADG